MGTETVEDVQQAQRARLLEGLAVSIREKGLAKTQVSDIVRHARASRRTFYNHFPDKEACFVELMTMLSKAILDEVERAIDRGAPAATQVDQAIDKYLELLMSDPDLTRTFASPSLGERIVMAQRESFERSSALIVSLVESEPGIEPIPQRRAYMLVTGLHQTLIRALVRGDDLGAVAADFKAVLKAVILP